MTDSFDRRALPLLGPDFVKTTPASFTAHVASLRRLPKRAKSRKSPKLPRVMVKVGKIAALLRYGPTTHALPLEPRKEGRKTVRYFSDVATLDAARELLVDAPTIRTALMKKKLLPKEKLPT